MIKKSIVSVLMAFVLMLGLGVTAPSDLVFAAGKTTTTTEGTYDDIPFKGEQATATDVETEAGTGSALGGLVGTMYKFATYISGLIFGVSVIMIVWAGFKYATSQGEQKTMETAKMQIITAGIGIGVALLAMVIVKVFAEIYGV